MSLEESFVGFEMDSKRTRDSSWRSMIGYFVGYMEEERKIES